MRKTKIVCTLGPSSADYLTIKKMAQAGMNVVRLNLSHAEGDFLNDVMKSVKLIRKELDIPLPVILDTRGPEVRIGRFADVIVQIVKNQYFIFTADKVLGNEKIVSINNPKLVKNIKVGDTILACDGLMSFKVVKIDGNNIITKSLDTGILSDCKSLFIPGVGIPGSYLNDEDKRDILWGIKNDVDFVAASFVNSKEDVVSLRKFINLNNGTMKIISKIESQKGVENLDDIIDVSDALMVARGDLGVELPIEKLPAIQKIMIKKCVARGKAVITATEMLESMIKNPRPTRAEVSDVANAVYDGTSCVMLSGETASGMYPLESVKTMAKVVLEAESCIDYNDSIFRHIYTSSVSDTISKSAVMTSDERIKAIIDFTITGFSAGLISRFRPTPVVIGATPNENVYRQLELLWGVKPVKTNVYKTTDEMFDKVKGIVAKCKVAKAKDLVVITCGEPSVNGGTNLMKIIEI